MSSSHSTQAETLTEVAAALVQKSPDGAELAGAVEALDRLAPDVEDLAARVSFGTALGVEQAGPQRQAI
jgi:hypothetical protein